MRVYKKIMDDHYDLEGNYVIHDRCICVEKSSVFDLIFAPINWLIALFSLLLTLITILPPLKPSSDPIGIRLINAYKARKNLQTSGDRS